MRVLRRGDNPLSFVKALRFDFIKRLGELLIKFREHAAILREPGRVQSRLTPVGEGNFGCAVCE
jgi:hypothetical protein